MKVASKGCTKVELKVGYLGNETVVWTVDRSEYAKAGEKAALMAHDLASTQAERTDSSKASCTAGSKADWTVESKVTVKAS